MRLIPNVQAKSSKPNPKRLGREGDVEGLRNALAYRDVTVDPDGLRFDLGVPVRLDALAILAESPDPRAPDAIVDALTDESPDVRLAALRATRDYEDERVIEALARGLAAPHIHERRFESEAHQRLFEVTRAWRSEALQALVELDSPRAVERVATHMVHRPGARALEEADLEVLRTLRSTWNARAALPELAERYAQWLGHDDPNVAARTAQVLVAFGESSLTGLVRALDDPQRRIAAIGAIGRLRDKSVSSSISVYAEDSDPEVRRAVMEALGEIRDPAAVRALLNGANDPVYEVRDAACAALDGVGTAAVIVAFTSVVGPALERIADTTELNAGLPRGKGSGEMLGIPRQVESNGAQSAADDEPSAGRSGIRQLFDSIVASRESARGRRQSPRQ